MRIWLGSVPTAQLSLPGREQRGLADAGWRRYDSERCFETPGQPLEQSGRPSRARRTPSAWSLVVTSTSRPFGIAIVRGQMVPSRDRFALQGLPGVSASLLPSRHTATGRMGSSDGPG